MFDPATVQSATQQSVSIQEIQAIAGMLKLMIGTVFAAAVAIVGITWRTAKSRSSEEQKIEHGEKAYREVYGVPDEQKVGLVARVTTVENGVTAISGRERALTHATGAHASDPNIVAVQVKSHFATIAREVFVEQEQVREARRAVIENQERRFSDRAHTPRPAQSPLHVDDPFGTDSMPPPPKPRR